MGIDLRYIGADGFADETIAVATVLVIRKETVAELIKAHDCKFLPHLTVIPTTFDGDSYDT